MRLAAAIGMTLVTGTLAGMLGAGCGGTETEPAAPNPFETVDGFCQKLAEAICVDEVVKACYLSDDANIEADKEQCLELASAPAVCNPGGYSYNSAGAKDCVDKTRDMYEDAELAQSELEAARKACHVVFSAGGPVGTSCIIDEECDGAEGLFCVKKLDGTGSCQVPVSVGAGLDCAGADAVCETGFYCNESNNCVAREGENEECSETLLCTEDTICTANVCLAKRANGDICATPDECLGGFCIVADGETTGQCGSFIPVIFGGDACGVLTP